MTAPALTKYTSAAQVSADQLNTFVQGCDTFAQLRGLTGVEGMQVFAAGRAADGDGYGGQFWWNPLNTAADDNLNVIVPGGVTLGGWNRLPVQSSTSNVGAFTNTQMHYYTSFLLGGIDPLAEWQAEQSNVNYATSALTVGAAVPASATVYGANGVASYVNSKSTTTNVVAGYFSGRALATGAKLWELNPVVDDAGFAATIQGIEVDVVASNTASFIAGVDVIGAFPASPTNAVGVVVQATKAGKWGAGFQTGDGVADHGLVLGAVSAAPGSAAQSIDLWTIDSTGTRRGVTITATPQSGCANLNFETPDGGGVLMSGLEVVAGFANFASAMTVTADGSALEGFYSGTTAVGSITTDGSTTAFNTTSDYRLKNITGASDGSLIDKLAVHVGSYKTDPTTTARSMVIAHEVQEVAPWLVTGAKDAVHETDVVSRSGKVVARAGDIVPQMVDLTGLIPDLIAKCQALEARLAALEAKKQ